MKFRDDFPLPDLGFAPTRPFWDAAARHELAVPRCDACARYVWYPDGACRFCGGAAYTWTTVSGSGRLFSWSVVHRPFIPQLADAVPYVTGLVAIDEDPAVRIVTRVPDCAPERLRIDMPMRVVFRPLRFAEVPGEVVAPMFVPG
ncbi:MAG TPA: OB-fold domain-containing protein [Candidatus Eisenbacteria bacterium]|nr:OB-fold domain-containing protein [Candidatus Eisenbacteria bacterium]